MARAWESSRQSDLGSGFGLYSSRVDPVVTARPRSTSWAGAYLRRVVIADALCGLAAGMLALWARFGSPGEHQALYLLLACALPVLWCVAVRLAGGYDSRFIGLGPDEFRRVLNAAVSLTAGLAIVSYATKMEIARGYVAIALPTVAALDLLARFWLRKRLHAARRAGRFAQRVVAVGHAPAVADLVALLRRDRYHGLEVVGACLAGGTMLHEIAGVPVQGGPGSVAAAVDRFGADTVAVLASPEMNALRLRELAWELEATGTDVYVAPALLDVAGPRTTIRPVAGLPLLHVDHPELTGPKQAVKAGFDKVVAGLGLLVTAPLFLLVAVRIKLHDHGPVFFRQVRVGKEGRRFRVFKFRTMVVDAEQQKTQLADSNEGAGALFKMRTDPRVTKPGAWLRRWSLDELPQLLNVLIGDMSLVGPRPALPDEVARYHDHMRRRLVVKPGITGLWQVSGRSDLSWADAVRLDLRYVENWSLALDLQVLWKTGYAVVRGSGAY
jgi:exopolysaccharide biosynthesis polyprenyl glycosylphosphotransferase